MVTLHLSTDALVQNHFLDIQGKKISTTIYKRIEKNIYSTAILNPGHTVYSTIGHGRPVYMGANPDQRVLLFEHPEIQDFEIPTLTKPFSAESCLSILDPTWSRISYSEALTWSGKINGHVGDYSTFILPNLSFFKELKAQAPDQTVTTYNLISKEKKKVLISELTVSPRTPQIFFLNLPFQKADAARTTTYYKVMVLPKVTEKHYEQFGHLIHEFVDQYLTVGTKIFDSPKAKEYEHLTKHWPNIALMLDDQICQDMDTYYAKEKPETYSNIKVPVISPAFNDLVSLSKNLKSKNTEFSTLSYQETCLLSSIENVQRAIQDYQRKLEREKESKSKLESVIEKTASELVDQQNKMQELKQNLPPVTFTEPALFNNYYIRRMYMVISDNTELGSDQLDILMKKIAEGYEITRLDLTLETKNPSILYVDKTEKGTNTIKCLAGPFTILITLDRDKLTGYIKAKDIRSIVGTSSVANNVLHMKAHPHAGSTAMDRTKKESIAQAYNNRTKICFGEAELNIKKAVSSANFSILFGAIDAWVTSINSKDTWGAEYTWFPLYQTGK